ncbi:hypothetical protein QI193_02785 [Staphylococcus saprophyticus]|nr:hypothetical protein [Staphylococcus saprophyticus]
MNTFEEQIKTAIKEIENKLGREFDPENETYILQTPSAYLQISIEENDEGEEEFAFNVTGGRLTYLETDIDIFESLYGNEDE